MTGVREGDVPRFTDLLPLGYYRADAGWRITHANPALLEMLGCRDLSELAGLVSGPERFGGKAARDEVMGRLEREGKAAGVAITLKTKAGVEAAAVEHVFTIHGPDGRVLGYEGLLSASAKEDEVCPEMCKRLAENMLDLVCQIDPRGKIEYISHSVRFVLGHNAPELAGRDVYDFIHPEDRERAEADFQKYYQTGTADNLKYRVLHANGEYRWLEARAKPIFDREFSLSGVLISARDVSELEQARVELKKVKRRAEEELERKAREFSETIERLKSDIAGRKLADQEQAEAGRRQEAIMRVMPVILYSAQLRTPFAAVWMSDNAGFVTGYPLERFLKEPNFWMERVHPDDRRTVEEYLGKVSTGETHQTEYRWQCADGEFHWFLDQVVNVQLSENNVTEYFGLWIDITIRKNKKAG